MKIIDMEFLCKCSFQFAIIIIAMAIAVYHALHLCFAVILKKREASFNFHLLFSPPYSHIQIKMCARSGRGSGRDG